MRNEELTTKETYDIKAFDVSSIFEDSLPCKLREALPVVREINRHVNNILNSRQSIELAQHQIADNAPLRTKQKIKYGVVIFFLSGLPMEILYKGILMAIIPVLKHGFIYVPLQIITAIAVAYFGVGYLDKRREKKRAKIEEDIAFMQKTINKSSEELNRIYAENKNVVGFIPHDYCYVTAVQFFIEVTSNGRAETMADAMNLYEEHLHRMTVEQNQRDIMNKQVILEQKVDLANANAAEAADAARWAAYNNYNR